jgi:surface antigen
VARPVKTYWRRPSYHGTPRACLFGGTAIRLPAVVLALALGGTTGGCSYQLDSMFGKKDEKVEKAEFTGSLAPKPVALTEPADVSAGEGDLAFARQAAAEVLSRGGKDTSAPWENPRTGARGTVTPLAAAYTQDGFVCRDFLASYVQKGSEAWLQGEACRMHQGKWEVRSLKPWKRS